MTDKADYLNTIFRQHVERQYGASMADEPFRRGSGQYAHEPHYTAMALRFRDFAAGYELALQDAAAGVVVNAQPCEGCGLDWCGASCGRWPTGSRDAALTTQGERE